MAFTRITNEDRVGKGNVGLPDTPLLSATDMQEQMDSLPNLAIDKFNAFLDELEDSGAASNIGCAAPPGITTSSTKLFGILNAIAAVATTSSSLSHTHANKASLDSLTASLVSELTALAAIFSGISAVQTSLTDSSTSLPTSSAVIDYVEHADLATPVVSAIFPIGAIYQTTTTDPDTLFGTTGKWTLLSTDSSGIKTYKRTA